MADQTAATVAATCYINGKFTAPLITPKDARSSLQMLSLCPSYGCALRLDRTPFDVLLGHTRKTLNV